MYLLLNVHLRLDLGRGLGLETLLSLFVRMYSNKNVGVDGTTTGLVFFLNAEHDEAERIVEQAQAGGPLDRPPQILRGDAQVTAVVARFLPTF